MSDIVINPSTVGGITTALAGATPGDRILLHATPGACNFTNDSTLVIDKAITIMNDPASTATPVLQLQSAGYFTVILNITASNVTLGGSNASDGFKIENTRGGGTSYGYMYTTGSISTVKILNCEMYQFRRFICSAVDGLEVGHCKVHNVRYTAFEIDGALNINFHDNEFWGEDYNYHGEAAITYYPVAAVGTSLITGNYICSYRVGIEVVATALVGAVTGTIDIAHNTLDMNMFAEHCDPSVYDCMLFGFSFWSGGTNEMNANAITVRDNIISRPKRYGLFTAENAQCFTTRSSLTVRNNLWYDCCWHIPNLQPIYEPQLTYEYYASDAITGSWITNSVRMYAYKGYWDASANLPMIADGVGTLGDFYQVNASGTWNTQTFAVGDFVLYDGSHWNKVPNANTTNSVGPVWGVSTTNDQSAIVGTTNIFNRDPMFVKSGTTPALYYKLLDYSPAAGNASDGGNIGADQTVIKRTQSFQDVPFYESLPQSWSKIWPLPLNKK